MSQEPTAPKTLQEVPSAKNIFLKWERLRLVYNAVLVVTVVVAWARWGCHHGCVHAGVPVFLIARAIMANVCFTAGPAVEAYASWLGCRARWLRPALFILGTLFAILLVVLSLRICRVYGGQA